MTNVDPVTSSNQNNDLMNADSLNDAEDDDKIPKNTATAIRNPHATLTTPLVQTSPSA